MAQATPSRTSEDSYSIGFQPLPVPHLSIKCLSWHCSGLSVVFSMSGTLASAEDVEAVGTMNSQSS